MSNVDQTHSSKDKEAAEDIESVSVSEETFNDSQASFVYNSAEAEDSCTSSYSDDEENYFGERGVLSESEDSVVAWEDSDEDSDLRAEMPTEAAWLNTKSLVKTVQRQTKKIKFRLSNKVFTSKYKLSHFKVYKDFKLAVDTFNIVYWIRSFDDFSTVKIDYFKITDVVQHGGRVMLASVQSSFIKIIAENGKVDTINKRTGRVKKMVAYAPASCLYIAGDKLFCFNKKMNLVEVFNQEFTDICVSQRGVYCLNASGDIFVFDHRLEFQRKLTFECKFEFQRIFCTPDNLFIGTEHGFYILDHNLVQTKELSNIKSCAVGLVHNKDFTIYGANHQNSLRILKNGLVPYDKFPFSKVFIEPISSLEMCEDSLYFTHSRSVSVLTLNYI